MSKWMFKGNVEKLKKIPLYINFGIKGKGTKNRFKGLKPHNSFLKNFKLSEKWPSK